MTGLDGTFKGSCVVCLQGTDTGLALVGEAEWVVAALMQLAIPKDQAMQMVESFCADELGCPAGQVPIGEINLVVRICASCSPFGVGLLADDHVPGFCQAS